MYDVNFEKVKEQFKTLDFNDYENPIKLFCDDIHTKWEQEQEKYVLTAIQNVGISVDKEELLKALRYDRNQYNEGYHAAQAKATNRVIDILAKLAAMMYDEDKSPSYKKAIEDTLNVIKEEWLEEDIYG